MEHVNKDGKLLDALEYFSGQDLMESVSFDDKESEATMEKCVTEKKVSEDSKMIEKGEVCYIEQEILTDGSKVYNVKKLDSDEVYNAQSEEDAIKKFSEWENVSEGEENVSEGREDRGRRDGTGPHKDSAMIQVSDKGRRQQAGEACPVEDAVVGKIVKGDVVSYKGRRGEVDNISSDGTIADIAWFDKEDKDVSLPVTVLVKGENESVSAETVLEFDTKDVAESVAKELGSAVVEKDGKFAVAVPEVLNEEAITKGNVKVVIFDDKEWNQWVGKWYEDGKYSEEKTIYSDSEEDLRVSIKNALSRIKEGENKAEQSLYAWNWGGDGYNDTYASDEKRAREIAKEISAELYPTIKNFRKIPKEMEAAYWYKRPMLDSVKKGENKAVKEADEGSVAAKIDWTGLEKKLSEVLGVKITLEVQVDSTGYIKWESSEGLVKDSGVFKNLLKSVKPCLFNGSTEESVLAQGEYWCTASLRFELQGGGSNGVRILTAWYYMDTKKWKFRVEDGTGAVSEAVEEDDRPSFQKGAVEYIGDDDDRVKKGDKGTIKGHTAGGERADVVFPGRDGSLSIAVSNLKAIPDTTESGSVKEVGDAGKGEHESVEVVDITKLAEQAIVAKHLRSLPEAEITDTQKVFLENVTAQDLAESVREQVLVKVEELLNVKKDSV